MGIGYMASCSLVVQPPAIPLCNDEMYTLIPTLTVRFELNECDLFLVCIDTGDCPARAHLYHSMDAKGKSLEQKSYN